MWASRTPNGPSVKCHVQNIHTMDELKMTGNCLKGSRGLCVFDGEWDTKEEWKLLKEMFSHVSSVVRVGSNGCGSVMLCAGYLDHQWQVAAHLNAGQAPASTSSDATARSSPLHQPCPSLKPLELNPNTPRSSRSPAPRAA